MIKLVDRFGKLRMEGSVPLDNDVYVFDDYYTYISIGRNGVITYTGIVTDEFDVAPDGHLLVEKECDII
jgi:hypothetical protein